MPELIFSKINDDNNNNNNNSNNKNNNKSARSRNIQVGI